MDYTAGPYRQPANETFPPGNQTQPTPANTTRGRSYPTSASVNITTGGPHILLFERDQNLVTLLSSELQLAGYECHTARTAVEVFDAIARYSVRLVLVNVAQAAAARREFWVALDTQRRGRGVQVLTFLCTNLAGYGPASEDPDDRSHVVTADIVVNGMTGINNMVNAVRSRIAVSNTSTLSRLTSNTTTNAPVSSSGSPPIGNVTVPIPAVSSSPSRNIQSTASNTYTPANAAQAPAAEIPRTPLPNHTDKIRAVIYPNQRSWSPVRDFNGTEGQSVPAREQQPVQETNRSNRSNGQAKIQQTSAPTHVDAYTNEQDYRAVEPSESGLAQLTRMLQEHSSPILEELANASSNEQRNRLNDETTLQQRVRQSEPTPLSEMALRASPIQDMPTDRINSSAVQHENMAASGTRRIDETIYPGSPASPPLMSIATPTPAPVRQVPPTPRNVLREEVNTRTYAEDVAQNSYVPTPPSIGESSAREEAAEPYYNDSDSTVAEELHPVPASNTMLPDHTRKAPDNALLIDIVQSLPPMPAPPQPPVPQVHNGRATRSLGSVLLEGHLVPQNRLEVANGIQRMLRGVDMNYQLGEILLMFKLLTPDQLLAASLVSYGLITPAQISALGRIRQELHSIGLEYDLENLLILFRILTSEQLREVRTSWANA